MPQLLSLLSKFAIRAFEAGRVDHVQQAAAVCFREVDQSIEVLLIASKRSKRWGIPKGTIESDESAPQAAAREAFEEAGVLGICEMQELGTFVYSKEGKTLPYHVRVYPLAVGSMVEDFPEKGLRGMQWVSLASAVDIVSDPALRNLLERLPLQWSKRPQTAAHFTIKH